MTKINKELEECRGVVAVLTLDDVEDFLWEEQIQQLHELLDLIEEGRKSYGKKESRLLIYGDKED